MRSSLLGVVLSAILAWSLPAWAQTQLGAGAINGVVSDETGGAVPGAQVRVVSGATGLSRDTTTGSAGTFSVPVLPPGTYEVTVALDGFAPWRAQSVEVNVGGSTTMQVTLQAAGVEEVVTVGSLVI